MAISPVLPVILQNGTVADANQVMADFFQLQTDMNTNAAHNGANSDITSLLGLTTPLPISEGGTGAATAQGARDNLGITAALNALVVGPVGSITLWTNATAPAHFFECNGQAVSRTTYASLFTVLGSTFGAGDGTTTFNIPDLRGQFARGWDDGAGVDPTRVFGSTQTDQFQTHTHTVTDPGHNHTYSHHTGAQGAAGSPNYSVDTVTTSNTSTATTGLTVTAPNTGNFGTETRPKNVALMYIIRFE